MQPRTIDEVIQRLDEIIQWAKANNSRLGYFPALYRKVTVSVKQGIADGFFEDGKRMERLDVLFAGRYFEALDAYRAGLPVKKSWEVAFTTADDWWAIVLQHLLLGINAHINVDLAIVAAQTCPGKEIGSLQEDFNKINLILGSLINKVGDALAAVWPFLRVLDWVGGRTDEKVIHFCLDVARAEAWNVALEFAALDTAGIEKRLALLDADIFKLGSSIQHPGPWLGTVTNFVRLGERGTVVETIELLEKL